MYDLVIANARIVDGSGLPPMLGHVAVSGGIIASVQSQSDAAAPRAAVEVDARGHVLCPGFVDVHSHDDFAALSDPRLAYKALQGVTTEVVGNCGIGAAPFPGAEDWLEKLHPGIARPGYSNYVGYLRALEESPPSLNCAVLAGHGALRRHAAPHAPRPLDGNELSRLLSCVDEALDAGVIGLSLGLIYEPGVFADRRELVEVARRVAPRAPLLTVHLRSEADALTDAVREVLDITSEAGVGLQLSHHKAHGRNNWGRVRESLALVDAAVERGSDVWLDQYPYTAGSTILSAVLARGGLSGGQALGQLFPEDIVIASCPAFRHLEGRDVGSIAVEQRRDPQEVAEEIARDEPRTWVVVHAMSENDVERVMAHPRTLFGSDGLPTEGARPHPRLFGTFPRILGHYCRERGILSLETAISKMTHLAAQRFGLGLRGLVRPDYHADLVLFDPERINARCTYEEPTLTPVGIQQVWVGGVSVVRDGEHTGARPGTVIRRSA